MQTRYLEEIFYNEGGKHCQRFSRELVDAPGTTQGYVGHRSEQPDLTGDVPAHCRTFGGPFKSPF